MSLLLVFAYLILNDVRKNYGDDYFENIQYYYLTVLFPLNYTALFLFEKAEKLHIKKNLFILLALLAEFTICEGLCKHEYGHFSSAPVLGLNYISAGIFIACGLILFIKINFRSQQRSAPVFFAYICCSVGFLFSSQISAVCLFFCTSALIIFLNTLYWSFFTNYYDILTGVFNKHSYIIRKETSFPLKYSVGIICIDNYEHLLQVFKKKIDNIILMIVGQIASFGITDIYRIEEDEFLLLFYEKDKTETFDKLEEIRRTIASDEFVVKKSQKPIKLTISASVAEKRRSDFDSVAVVIRARAALKQSYTFTQNITSKA